MQNKDFSYIASLARTLAGTNAENFPDSSMVIEMNLIRNDMQERVSSRGKSSPFWDEAVLDIINEETEYPLPGNDDDKPIDEQYFAWMRTIKKVFVKYSDTEEYQEVPFWEIDSPIFQKNPGKRYYSIADNSLFLFPMPMKYVADGIIVHGVNTLRPVEIGALENKIFGKRLPTQAFETLALGIAVRYCRYYKRDFNEAQALEVEYEKELNRLIWTFKARSVRIYDNEPVPVRTDLQ